MVWKCCVEFAEVPSFSMCAAKGVLAVPLLGWAPAAAPKPPAELPKPPVVLVEAPKPPVVPPPPNALPVVPAAPNAGLLWPNRLPPVVLLAPNVDVVLVLLEPKPPNVEPEVPLPPKRPPDVVLPNGLDPKAFVLVVLVEPKPPGKVKVSLGAAVHSRHSQNARAAIFTQPKPFAAQADTIETGSSRGVVASGQRQKVDPMTRLRRAKLSTYLRPRKESSC